MCAGLQDLLGGQSAGVVNRLNANIVPEHDTISNVMKQQFFPSSDRPEVLVDVTMPQGSSTEVTQAAVIKVENWLRAQRISPAPLVGNDRVYSR